MKKEIYITKASGERELFSEAKLRSLGLSEKKISDVIREVNQLYER